jgi:hypothetical protein
MGASFDWSLPVFQWTLAVADSAERVNAPPGSVRVLVNPADSGGTYVKIGSKK